MREVKSHALALPIIGHCTQREIFNSGEVNAGTRGWGQLPACKDQKEDVWLGTVEKEFA